MSVADEPKPPTESPNISPAPADVTEGKPDQPSSGKVASDPLPDGTVPTVIQAGESHRSVAKSHASLTKIYRKADILTTVFTAGGIVLALAVIGGVYLFVSSRNKPAATQPKVTTLNQSDLDKLGAFFQGNTAGSNDQVLTIAASTLFKNRVATSSDLKVVGGAEVSGSTSLSDLSVSKTSTLSIVNVKGQLVVDGPANLKGALLLGAGASMSGNLTVSGTGSFAGTLSAGTLNVTNVSVSGTLNLAGHLSIAGQNPSAAPGSEAGSGATASVDGNDASGTVTVTTGTVAPQLPPVGGLLVKVVFKSAYPRTPHIIISPDSQGSASLQTYVLKTATDFTIGFYASSVFPMASSNTSYSFDYWVVQ